MNLSVDPSDLPELDTNILEQLRQDLGEGEESREMLKNLLQDYRTDSGELIASIHKAIEDNDAYLLQRSGHTLKSNSAMFGAMRLSMIAKKVEELGRSGSFDGALELVSQIETQFEIVKRLLP